MDAAPFPLPTVAAVRAEVVAARRGFVRAVEAADPARAAAVLAVDCDATPDVFGMVFDDGGRFLRIEARWGPITWTMRPAPAADPKDPRPYVHGRIERAITWEATP